MDELDRELAPLEDQGLALQASSDRAGTPLLREVMERTPPIHAAYPNRAMNFAVGLANASDPDRESGLGEAEAALRAALSSPWLVGDADLRAQVQMNLALVIAERRPVAERVREAIELARAASQHRTRDREAVNWAFAAVNLGVALRRLGSPSAVAEARSLYGHVTSADVPGATQVTAMARMNLLRLDWESAFPTLTEESDFAAHFARAPVSRSKLLALAEQARVIAEDYGARPETRGEAQRRLAEIFVKIGDDEKAEVALLEAIGHLDDSDLAAHCAALFELGLLYARSRDWGSAVAPLRTMLEVTETLVMAPASAAERARQMESVNRRARFAAAIFAEAGHVDEAVEAIENGRTRELRWRLVLSENSELAVQDVGLRARVADAMAARRRGSAGSESAMRATLDEVRLALGEPYLGTRSSLTDIQAAASTECPLIYVNPFPDGCWMFVLDGRSVDARRLPISGAEIVRLVTGIDVKSPLAEGDISYAFATTGEVTGGFPYLSEALRRLLPRIGEAIASPISEALDGFDARAATLIAGGPLATVPIGAATWGDGRCLLDTYALATTPSAILHASCRRRATSRPARTFDHLVATADPSLPSAPTEISTAAKFFSGASIPEGLFATGQWLIEHARAATVLHAACHGFADLVDPEHSGLVLANGPFSSGEIARLDLRNARLAIASACETGVTGIGQRVDEALSVGSALLEAGAVCAIASLWPVSDEATELLMARFYERLLATEQPVAALVEAQSWMRNASEADCLDLADRFASTGVSYTRRRPIAEDGSEDLDVTPFSDPVFWAPFVALGA